MQQVSQNLEDQTPLPRAPSLEAASVERALKTVMDNAPAAVAVFDREMRYLWVSQRWIVDFNLGSQPILGRSHYEIFPEIPERWKLIHQRCLAGATESSNEDSFLGLQGTRIWLKWKVQPWRFENGEIGGLVIFSEDITVAKSAELALQQSEEKLKVLNSELRALISSKTRELEKSELRFSRVTALPRWGWPLRVTMRFMEQLTLDQRSRGVRVGFAVLVSAASLTLSQVFDGQTDAHLQTVLILIASGAITLFSGLGIGLAASVVMYAISDLALTSFSGELVTGTRLELVALLSANLLVGAMILLFKESYRRAILASSDAHAANQAKSQFLAGMSHEIRTPLGAIMGFSELLTDPETPVEDRARYSDAVKRNGEILSKLIDDILDLSRVEAGKMSIEKKDVVLKNLIQDVESVMQRGTQLKENSLHFHVESDLPERISTDSVRLRQILINLIGNANKFTQAGAIGVHVRWLNPSKHDLIAFDVSDTGKGIEPDKTQKLFQIFSQAHTDQQPRYGGTGIGLALSRSLARLLGGDLILAQTAVGHGSTFTLTIQPT